MSKRNRTSRGSAFSPGLQKIIPEATPDPMDRFGSKVTPLPSGCWRFGAPLDHYGRFSNMNAHRWLWEALHGPILDGDHVHHSCENKGCVNPAHLQRLTPSEHTAEHHRLRAS